MKIVTIFAGKLYAIQYMAEPLDIYTQLIENWTDVYFVRNFVKEHQDDINSKDLNQVVQDIITDAESIDDTIIDLASDNYSKIDEFFVPLHPSEYKVQSLSKQKGRIHYKSYTRIYGIQIETDCYIITGGAIKFTQYMQDRPHTQVELNNINKVRDYLISEDIIDKDSFLDLLNQ